MPLHPATAYLISYFGYHHLPEQLQQISRPFYVLATDLAAQLDGPELTVCLRKLLEAKDCAVRAALPTVAIPIGQAGGQPTIGETP